MPPTNVARYTLTELANLAGVTPRTVRYYIAQGLLPAAPAPGPGAKYGDGQLARLRLIRRLQRDHQPLAAIRRQLERLDDSTILDLAGEPAPAPSDSALDYIRRVMTGRPSAAQAGGLHVAAPSPIASDELAPTQPPARESSARRPVAAAPPAIHPSAGAPRASEAPAFEPAAARLRADEPPAVDLFVTAPRSAAAPTASDPADHLRRAQWERITLAPDIELHVRRPLPRTLAKRVDRLVSIARDLLEEDPT